MRSHNMTRPWANFIKQWNQNYNISDYVAEPQDFYSALSVPLERSC